MANRSSAADFFEMIEERFGHLRDDDLFEEECSRVSAGEVKLLEMLRGVVEFMPELEQAVTEVIGLAMVTSDEAEKFEKAVMSDPEGREVVERLYRQRPYLFSGLIGAKGTMC